MRNHGAAAALVDKVRSSVSALRGPAGPDLHAVPFPVDDDHFRAIFESAPVAMCSVDTSGRLIETNRAYQELVGYSRDELRNLHFIDITHPDDVERNLELHRAQLAGETFRMEKRYVRKDGGIVWVDVCSEFTTDDRGRPTFSVTYVIDITARKHAEEAARESEQRLRRMFDSSQIPMCFTDGKGLLLETNEAFQRLLGYTSEELEGTSCESYTHPEDLERSAHALREQADRTGGFRLEKRYVRKDGDIVWADLSWTVLEDDHGGPLMSFVIAQDISERKRAEQALRESEERFRRLAENAPDVVWRYRVSPEPAWEFVNPTVSKMLGYAPEDFYADPELALEIVHPDDRPLLDEVVQARVPIDVVLRWRHRDGQIVFTEMRSAPVLEEDGTLVAVDAIARDITQRRLSEQALREADQQVRLALEGSKMVAWDLDLDTDSCRWIGNDSESTFGLSLSELPRSLSEVVELVHPDDRPQFEATIPERRERGSWEIEFRIAGRSGVVRWVTSRGAVIRDKSGKPVRVLGTWVDITERKEAERKLATRARQQAAVVELGRVALAGTPPDELMEHLVTIVAETLDVEYAKVLALLPSGSELLLRAGVGWEEGLVGSAVVSSGLESQAGYTLIQRGPVVVEDLREESRFHGPPLLFEHGVVSGLSVVIPGGEQPFGVLGAHTKAQRHFDEDDANFLQAIAHVLSEALEWNQTKNELTRSVDLLRRTDEERRNLLARLVTAQEEERQRIALDIHDDSVQVMTALALRLDLLRQRIADTELLRAVEEAADTVRASIRRLRQLIFQLRPPALDRDGLGAALHLYLDELKHDRGLDYHLESQLSTEPAPEARAVLFRIAQEALLNVAKHAGATRVDVEVGRVNGGVLVRIVDDGKGFSPDFARSAAASGHLGLFSMRERAELAGGWCRVESDAGEGTTVEAFVPDRMEPVAPAAVGGW